MGTVQTTRPSLRSGFTEVFFDSFDTANTGEPTGLDRNKWGVLYGDSVYGNGAFRWSHDDVRVDQNNSNEVTVSATYHPEITSGPKWTAGGFSSLSPWDGNTETWQYGLFEFSAKVEKGQGTGPAVLLWPADNSWPPEIDMLESPDANRQGMYFTVHWKGGNGEHIYKSYKFADVDASQWHTYGLEWSKNHLTFFVDGVKRQEHYEGDPNMKMAFGIQMFVASEWDDWYGGPPNQATMDNGKIDLSVDWVRVAQKNATTEPTSPPPTSPTSPQPINGTSSADTLRGTEQGEVINGVAGNDTIYGNGGDDTIIGGSGRDTMTGGAGRDTFDFNAYAESYSYSSLRDQILDFTPGTDRIDLSTIDANSSVSGDQAFVFQGTAGFSGGGRGSVRYSQGGSSSSPYTLVDVDNGNGGSPEMSIQLSGWKTLAAADLVL